MGPTAISETVLARKYKLNTQIDVGQYYHRPRSSHVVRHCLKIFAPPPSMGARASHTYNVYAVCGTDSIDSFFS